MPLPRRQHEFMVLSGTVLVVAPITSLGELPQLRPHVTLAYTPQSVTSSYVHALTTLIPVLGATNKTAEEKRRPIETFMDSHSTFGCRRTSLRSPSRPSLFHNARLLAVQAVPAAQTGSRKTKGRRTWLGGRYTNATWDVDELVAKKDEIVKGDKLVMRMVM